MSACLGCNGPLTDADDECPRCRVVFLREAVARLTHERARLTRELEEARAVLRSVEWFQYEDAEGASPPQCPVCLVYPEFYWHPKWDEDPTKRELRAKNDHAPDCRLAAVLGEGR